jgi:hypothetical protein
MSARSDNARFSILSAAKYEVQMTPAYDIFKKASGTNIFIWIEAAEDIVSAKKRLFSLVSTAPAEYRLWDCYQGKFVNPLDDAA